MVDPVPAVVASFFAQYPDGKDLLMTEDGSKVYLNHFKDQAVQEAKRSGAELWKIDKDNNQERVYPEGQPTPTTYTYTLNYNHTDGGNITAIDFDGDVYGASISSVGDVETVFSDLFTTVGVTGTVSVVEATDIWEITLELSAEANVAVTDSNTVSYSFQLV